MKTMKKFLRYFILFILLFLWVSGMTYIGTKNMNKEEQIIECVTQTTSPVSNKNVTDVKVTSVEKI